jgi:Asp-tRNA(Asn)/Glu-tRNA(Gln) amidotransferase A subunit family amidase
LKQIERLNPKLNVFVTLLADEARQRARELEQTPDDERGPLHGVALTVKECFDYKGLPTYCGSRFLGKTPATEDSAAVRRFQDAGAIILGKTNTPEFLANYESDNYIIGRTNNPWDLERTPGGSSGGESAAISARMSAGGIGSDGGGSVRIPAHFCGIAGLKPTPGRVSAAGHVPAINHPGGLLGVAGPMARTVKDVKALFEVLSPYDLNDPFAAPVPLREPDLKGLRIGVMEQFLKVPVQQVMTDTVRRAARVFEDLGFPVDEFAPVGFERAPNVWAFFFTDLPSRATAKFIAGREQDAHWTGTEFLSKIVGTPEPGWEKVLEMLAERDRLRLLLMRQMEGHRVLLLPPCGVPAFKHRERGWETATKKIGLFEAMMPVTVFNLAGFPGLVVPFGFSDDGMPVGVQLVARPYDEELLLELGMRLEEARGEFPAPKMVELN